MLCSLQAAVLAAAKVIVESCRNLLQFLEDLACSHGVLPTHNGTSSSSSTNGSNGSSADAAAAGIAAGGSSSSSMGARFKSVLVAHVQAEGVIDWLVPPMLQGNNVDLDGWV